MKWVTILSLAIVLSLTESRILQKRDHHEDHHDDHHDHGPKLQLVGEAFKLLGKEPFDAIALVLFSQFLEKCPFEEQMQRVNDISVIGEKCSKGARSADCGKSVLATVVDEMCKTPENTDKYPFHPGCCAKQDPDRYKCFMEHKSTDPDAVPPYQKPSSEETCKNYQDNRVSFMAHYMYEVARRHSMMYAPAIVSIANSFEHIASDCCKDAATQEKCFGEKMPAHVKEIKIINAIQQHSCYVLKSFNERVLSSIKMVQTAQKFPMASYEATKDIAHDLVHMSKTCCSGDMMRCMEERLALTTKTCAKKDQLSTKLAACCDKSIIERSPCIVRMDNDDKPADLSAQVRYFIEDVSVCKKYEEKKDDFVGLFLYEYARRHPEMSTQMLLKIGKGYQALLTKCCAVEDKLKCLGEGEGIMQKQVQASVELLKQTCGALDALKSYHFQNELLMKYTKKMPQVPTPALIQLTSAMTHVGEYCCKVPAEKQLPCSEGSLSLIIGDMCQKQEANFINDQVSHCCRDSYAAQRSCFTELGPDKSYVPPAPSVDYFKFTEKLCAVADPKAVEVTKQTFLVGLMKLKPEIEAEQMKTITADFLGMQDQCCKADNHAECFETEGPKLIAKCQALLGLPAAV